MKIIKSKEKTRWVRHVVCVEETRRDETRREEKRREEKRREEKRREEKRREEKRREGKGREGKGREGKRRITYKVLFGKTEGKRPRGRSRRRQEDNIEMGIKYK
jgi:hypothetical protein